MKVKLRYICAISMPNDHTPNLTRLFHCLLSALNFKYKNLIAFLYEFN